MRDIRERFRRSIAPEAPPGPEADDRVLVPAAASALELREIELFRLAWWRWYDAPPNPALVERAFAAYMFHGAAPPWVRQLAYQVLARAREDRLEPADFGADRVRRVEQPAKHPRLAVAAFTAAIAVFLILLVNPHGEPVNNPQTARSAYCHGGAGSAYVRMVARQFTGKADPFRCR